MKPRPPSSASIFHRPPGRWPIALAGALVATLLLFRIMAWLIPAVTRPVEQDVVRLLRVAPPIVIEEPQTTRRTAPLLEAPADLPPVPAASGGLGTYDVEPEEYVPDILEPGLFPVIGIDTIDSVEPVPLVQISPQYPLREWTRGVEGYVDIRMDIGADGVPRNLEVVGSEPGEAFATAALRSVASWRYAPVTIDGKAVSYQNYVVRVAFLLGGELPDD